VGVYQGPSPEKLSPGRGIRNPVLTRRDITDVRAAFVADPFALRSGQTWHLFFEVFNEDADRGQIAVATSRDRRKWQYEGIVLDEPFHLSYPHVFEWQGQYYMTPESYQAGSVRLYRASAFPYRWSLEQVLIETAAPSDPSVFRYDGRWWMFVGVSLKQKFDGLRLFHAGHLSGPWVEHCGSPVVAGDPRMARPGGRVIAQPGRLLRWAQDCWPVYGTQVRLLEISELTTSAYGEREVRDSPILGPGNRGWNRGGMHHVDAHQLESGSWVAYVDGRPT
jgi:hypothetical protein